MILQCPSCSARYAVPDNKIGATGRKVRCAKCAHLWHVDPPESEITPTVMVSPDTKPDTKKEAPSLSSSKEDLDKVLAGINNKLDESDTGNVELRHEGRPSLSPRNSGQSGTAKPPALKRKRSVAPLKYATYALVPVLMLLMTFAWSPELLGLHPSKGLVLADVEVTKRPELQYFSYRIKGKVVNSTPESRTLHIIRFSLLDAEGNQLEAWSVNEDKEMFSGDKIMFDSGDLDVPYDNATRLVIEIGNSIELALRGKPE